MFVIKLFAGTGGTCRDCMVAQVCNPATVRQRLGMVWNVSNHIVLYWESRFRSAFRASMAPAGCEATGLAYHHEMGGFSVLLVCNTDDSLAAYPLDRAGYLAHV